MKVARYRAYGSPENIESAEQPDPVAGTGQLLVKVHASSVNPIDWKMAGGHFPFNLVRPGLPYLPGFDVAGEVVTAAGDFPVGARVHSRLPTVRGGASAELVAVHPRDVAPIPEGMSYADAAAIPLAGMTALQGLRDHARLPLAGADGYRVLVVGASGGVGHFGVQIARAAGAHVTGLCSGRNAELVRSLGAHEVVDYTTGASPAAGGAFDVILDCVGSQPATTFTPWLTARGVYASTAPTGATFAWQLFYALTFRRRVRAVMLGPSAADLRWLDGLAARGALRAHVDATFPLARLADAHRMSIAGRTRGKIVIAVAE
ncbi:MAG: Zn-dependent oxidoreductase, NADPH:quinone reductase [Myxococcaceae bacterium]|nr:Zn-dependent oxidoreductase, NADPH:quinone reductase [Myxococcaceae bacterium]